MQITMTAANASVRYHGMVGLTVRGNLAFVVDCRGDEDSHCDIPYDPAQGTINRRALMIALGY